MTAYRKGTWPTRIAAQMAARLLDHGVCPHCLGAGRVVDLGDGDLPTRMVEAQCPACAEDGSSGWTGAGASP